MERSPPCSLLTTTSAGPRYPLYADAVSDLDNRVFAAGAELHHFACAFVATYSDAESTRVFEVISLVSW